MLPTRTILQVRTHAQKYFDKVDKGEPFPTEPYPSQYDRAAGRAGVAAGAYMYGVPKHEPQQKQDLHHLRRHQLREQQHAAGSAEASGPRRPLLVSHSEEQQRAAGGAKPAGPPNGGGTGGKSMGLPLVAACTQAYGDTSDTNIVVAGNNSGGNVRVSGGSSGQSLFPNWSNSAGAAACAPGWLNGSNGEPVGAAPMPMPVAPDVHHGRGFDGSNIKLDSVAFCPSARFLDELQGSGGDPGKGFACDESFQQPQFDFGAMAMGNDNSIHDMIGAGQFELLEQQQQQQQQQRQQHQLDGQHQQHEFQRFGRFGAAADPAVVQELTHHHHHHHHHYHHQEQEQDFPVDGWVDMPLDMLLLYGDSGDGGSVADGDGACVNIDLEFDTVNGFGLL
ncbi:unnamed protein product [Ectocarpus sp. 13 AM-2016]